VALTKLEARRALIFGGVATVSVLAALGPVSDGDIYWHLAAGRWMLHQRAFLRADPFTLSAYGRPWTDVHWLFQIGATLVHRVAGFQGLTALKAALVAATALIMTRVAERSGGLRAQITCALLLGAGLVAARHQLALRPIVVTLFFLALTLNALESWRLGEPHGRWRLPLTFAGVQILWVNCQGLAPLGLGLAVAYWVGGAWTARGWGRREPAPTSARDAGHSIESAPSRLRVLGWAIVVGVGASLVTPYGVAGVTLPLRLAARLVPEDQNVFSASVAENIPPLILARTHPEQIAHLIAALACAALVLIIARPRLPPAHLLVLCSYLVLALAATRNIILLYVVAPPLLGIGLASLRGLPSWAKGANPLWAGQRRRTAVTHVLPWLAVTALASEIGLAALVLSRDATMAQPTPFRFPVESARRLAARGARGPIFAPDHQGGYLTFHVPALRPFIDTRLILHTAPEYAAYLAAVDDPARFDQLNARTGFQYAVLTTSTPDRFLRLAVHLLKSPDWKVLYTDGTELLFERARRGALGSDWSEPDAVDLRDPTTVASISRELGARFAADPTVLEAATLHLARLLIVAGDVEQSERVLERSSSWAALGLRARARFVRGDFSAAEALTRMRLAAKADDVPSLALLGEIALARDHLDESKTWLHRALTINPFAPEALAALARLEAAGAQN